MAIEYKESVSDEFSLQGRSAMWWRQHPMRNFDGHAGNGLQLRPYSRFVQQH